MRPTTITRTLATVLIASAITCAVGPLRATPALAACTCPLRSDNACLDMAASAVGSWYKWGGACWKTTDREWGGADCSGLVVKAWQVPRSSKITENYHPYGTWHLFNHTTHWYAVKRASLWKGDIVGYSDPDGDGPASGHVVMYYYGDKWGLIRAYEAPRTGQRIKFGWRDISASKWKFRRRHNLIQTLGPG